MLLGVGFLAGLVTALSPCVLPVLPVLLAGGASGGRGRPLAIVAGLVASFATFTLVGAWLLDAARPAPGPAAEHRHRRAARARGDARLPAPGARPGAALLPAHALPRGLREQRAPARRQPGPRLRAVRRAGARRGDGRGREPAISARGRSSSPSRTRAALPLPMLAVAAGSRRLAEGVTVLRAHALGVRRAAGVVIGATALADRLRRRPALHDRRARLHRGAAGADRAELGGTARAARPARRGRRPGGRVRGRGSCRAGLPRDRRVGQHAGRAAAEHGRPSRQGRARRLLDVLVRQLPAHAAAPARLGRHVPRLRPAHRGRAHARVRVRARPGQRAQTPSAASSSTTPSRSTTSSARGTRT